MNYGDKVALIDNTGSVKASMLKIITGKNVPGTEKKHVSKCGGFDKDYEQFYNKLLGSKVNSLSN